MPAWGGFFDRSSLAGGNGEQLGGQGLDLALDRRGVDGCVGVGQARRVLGADSVVAFGAPVRGGRDVLLLGYAGPVAGL